MAGSSVRFSVQRIMVVTQVAVVALEGVCTGRVEVRMAGGLTYEATAAMMMQALETVGETTCWTPPRRLPT